MQACALRCLVLSSPCVGSLARSVWHSVSLSALVCKIDSKKQMVGNTALLVIDAQADFDKWITATVAGNITEAVQLARLLHHPVAWIYSHYRDPNSAVVCSAAARPVPPASESVLSENAHPNGGRDGEAAAAAADEPAEPEPREEAPTGETVQPPRPAVGEGEETRPAAATAPRRVAPSEDLDAFVRMTHEGRTPMCVAGSPGAELSARVKHLIDSERDGVVKKQGYS